MQTKTNHLNLWITAALTLQALACASSNGADTTDSADTYPPEWDLVGAAASSGDLPEGPESPPQTPTNTAEAPPIKAHIFTPANPNGSRSRQRGVLQVCFDDTGSCCSASFLNNASIVTAAHCLPQPNRNALHNVSLKYEMPGATRTWKFNNIGVRPGDPFCPECRDGRMFFYPHPNQNQSNKDKVSSEWDVAVGNICNAGAACDTGGAVQSFNLSDDHFVTFLNKPPWDNMNMTVFGYGMPELGVKHAMRLVVEDANSNDVEWRKWALGEWVCGGDSGSPAMRNSGYSDAQGEYWMTQTTVMSNVDMNASFTRPDGSVVPCGDSGMASRIRGKIGWISSIVQFWAPKTCKNFTNRADEPATWCWANP